MMNFLATYWPQIVMVITLIVIMAVFIRRMPKTLPQEVTQLSKREVAMNPSQIGVVWRHVREWTVLTFDKLKKWFAGVMLKVRASLARRKQDTAAVSHMFDASKPQKDQPLVAPRGSVRSVVPHVPSRMSRGLSALKTRTMRGGLSAKEADKKRKTDELIRRAKQYLNETRNKDAEETFIEAATMSPRDERIYLEMGNMYLKAGNYSDAKAAFREVLKLASTNLDVIAKLGLIAYREKRFDEAASRYETARRLAPKETKYVANVALALRASGKTKRAWKLYMDAYEMKNTEVDYGLKAIELGLELGRERKVEPLLEAITKLDPANPKLLELRARMTQQMPQ